MVRDAAMRGFPGALPPCYALAALSIDRFKLLRRGALAGAVALASVVMANSCGFPDKTFIDDDEFFGRGKGTGGGEAGSSGPDAALGMGGSAGSGGGGAGGTGTGAVTSAGGSDDAGGMSAGGSDAGSMT